MFILTGPRLLPHVGRTTRRTATWLSLTPSDKSPQQHCRSTAARPVSVWNVLVPAVHNGNGQTTLPDILLAEMTPDILLRLRSRSRILVSLTFVLSAVSPPHSRSHALVPPAVLQSHAQRARHRSKLNIPRDPSSPSIPLVMCRLKRERVTGSESPPPQIPPRHHQPAPASLLQRYDASQRRAVSPARAPETQFSIRPPLRGVALRNGRPAPASGQWSHDTSPSKEKNVGHAGARGGEGHVRASVPPYLSEHPPLKLRAGRGRGHARAVLLPTLVARASPRRWRSQASYVPRRSLIQSLASSMPDVSPDVSPDAMRLQNASVIVSIRSIRDQRSSGRSWASSKLR